MRADRMASRRCWWTLARSVVLSNLATVVRHASLEHDRALAALCTSAWTC
jgi:hypothetical protein